MVLKKENGKQKHDELCSRDKACFSWNAALSWVLVSGRPNIVWVSSGGRVQRISAFLYLGKGYLHSEMLMSKMTQYVLRK